MMFDTGTMVSMTCEGFYLNVENYVSIARANIGVFFIAAVGGKKNSRLNCEYNSLEINTQPKETI